MFYSTRPLTEHNIDIFAIAETKLDSSFFVNQFLPEGIKKSYRFDVSSGKVRLLVYVNKNILLKYLWSFHLPNDVQFITTEVNLKQRKLLVFLSSITDLLDHYLTIYEDFTVLADFNESETNPALDLFLDEQKCKNIKNKTCLKSVKGSCIDLTLTKRPSLLATIAFCFTQYLSLRN